MENENKMDLRSMDITQTQKEKLKQLFPEVFNEDKIDFEKLKLALGEDVDMGRERFGMNWPGKAKAIQVAQEPSFATLKPNKEASVDFDTTENLFIEGDNLEVLKLLQKSYFGKIKMIYIDPPYNTGKEFIYPDKYSEGLDTYLQYTGQVDVEGKKFTTNTETDGRYHSKWMNMMWPRLFLARNLLTESGVIFISIGDNEVDNLIKICNEIFGEDNFVSNIVWRSRTSISNDLQVSPNHNYTLIYSKNISSLVFRGDKLDPNDYKNIDDDKRGPWKLVPIDANKPGGETLYPIVNPATGIQYLPPNNRSWAFNKETFQMLYNDGRIKFGIDDNSSPKKKLFYNERIEKGDTKTPSSVLIDAGTTKDGTKDVAVLFDGKEVFDYPKPISLLKRLVQFGSEKNSIILDFFAGSGTTAHAVMQLNAEDGGNRKFIMTQLPESTDENSEAHKAGYKNITEIGEERIHRAGKKILEENKDKEGFDAEKFDKGFKVYKLDKSNFSIWNGENNDGLQEKLKLHVHNIDPNSNDEDILNELLLKAGYSLTEKIEEISIDGKKVYSISNDELLICLELELNKDVMKNIAYRKPKLVICLNSGFASDADLTNTSKVMKNSQIEFRTV